MSNHEKHIELIEKHINFTKTGDGLNSSIKCFCALKDSLWRFLRNEHDLILLDSKLFEIIHLIDKFRSENQS